MKRRLNVYKITNFLPAKRPWQLHLQIGFLRVNVCFCLALALERGGWSIPPGVIFSPFKNGKMNPLCNYPFAITSAEVNCGKGRLLTRVTSIQSLSYRWFFSSYYLHVLLTWQKLSSVAVKLLMCSTPDTYLSVPPRLIQAHLYLLTLDMAFHLWQTTRHSQVWPFVFCRFFVRFWQRRKSVVSFNLF